jgi:hypothetical protein
VRPIRPAPNLQLGVADSAQADQCDGDHRRVEWVQQRAEADAGNHAARQRWYIVATVAPPVTHVFRSYQEARDGIRALEAGGVKAHSISILTRSPEDAELLERDTGASDNLEDASVDRGRFGFLVDWLGRLESATVPGFGAVLGSGNLLQDIQVAGHGHGAITGALVGSGIPVDEAANLEKAVDEGQILVVVHS